MSGRVFKSPSLSEAKKRIDEILESSPDTKFIRLVLPNSARAEIAETYRSAPIRKWVDTFGNVRHDFAIEEPKP